MPVELPAWADVPVGVIGRAGTLPGTAWPICSVESFDAGTDSLSSTRQRTCECRSPRCFSPECCCAGSHRATPAGSSTSTEFPLDEIRRREPLTVIITLSGWLCSVVLCPGESDVPKHADAFVFKGYPVVRRVRLERVLCHGRNIRLCGITDQRLRDPYPC